MIPPHWIITPDGRRLIRVGKINPGWHGLKILETATLGEEYRIELPQNGLRCALSPDNRRLVLVHWDTTFTVWDWESMQSRAWNQAAIPATPLEDLWKRLASPEPRIGQPAVHALTADPRAAITLLRERFQSADAARIAGLIANLGNEDFAEREKASNALAAIGAAAEPALREALQSESPEVRDRAARLLRAIRPTDARRTANAVRVIRAVEVLERIGTKEAAELLAKWAKENPGTTLGDEAKAATVRLAARK